MKQRRVAIVAGVLIVLAIVVLTIDYGLARRRAPGDDTAILRLQEQVRENASLAPKLEAEHLRITRDRDHRKQRIRALSWMLIIAGCAFVWAAKPAGPPAPPPPPQSAKGCAGPVPLKRSRPRTEIPVAQVVDEIVAREGTGPESAVPILQAIQEHFRYLPDEALARVCEVTAITPAQIAGTSSFYARFRRSPVGRHVVRVCHGTACHVSGARAITDELHRSLNIAENASTDPDRLFTVDEVACLGCCSLAPVMTVDEHTVGKLTPAAARDVLEPIRRQEIA